MSPRVAYWTSAFEPEMEGIAGEIALLRQQFPSSIAWGLNRRHWALMSCRRGFCLHPSLRTVFHAATRILEPAFQLNHVFGSLGSWCYLRGPHPRRTVLTIVTLSDPVERRLLESVNRFVAEDFCGREHVLQSGIPKQRVQLIFPPVDLDRFRPASDPPDRFTLLFASSPEDEDWLEARGVSQILAAAAARPQMRFRLLWRPWGNAVSTARKWICERGLRNVDVDVRRVKDMAAEYCAAHATLVPFTRMDRCKTAPNSLVESVACGRPVVCSDSVGLSPLVAEYGAGIVCFPAGESMVEALDRIQAEWKAFSEGARTLAERHFDQQRFVDSYRRLYEQVLQSPEE